jgi:2-polyprenyl-6-methoxyphenol hydroxylase-like FAD-dependent oxidoreductase
MSRNSAADARGRRIAIAGAGIGGLALAARLARLGHSPVIFEGRSEVAAVSEGTFLTLAPNGMNGLRLVDADAAVEAAGIDTTGIEIRSSSGKRLNLADQRDHRTTFGAPSITLGRGMLAALLLERARQAGAEVRFDAAVAAVDARFDGVTVRLADGSTYDADVLVAADGLRSTVRGLVFPDYPQPAYTGLIGTGGTVEADIEPTGGVMRMTFGDLAFFGYIRPADGPVYWFNSYPAEESEIGRIADPGGYARRIGALHAGDPEPNARILAVVDRLERNYPVYDMPALPGWHRGRVVLMGDAAHAIGPHTGQGASMAIEDAMILAACLDVEAAPETAFARYEAIRRRRVEQVVMLTRRLGSQKRASGWLSVMIRDLLLPLVIPFGIKAGRKLFAYRVDRDPVMCPANKREDRE